MKRLYGEYERSALQTMCETVAHNDMVQAVAKANPYDRFMLWFKDTHLLEQELVKLVKEHKDMVVLLMDAPDLKKIGFNVMSLYVYNTARR